MQPQQARSEHGSKRALAYSLWGDKLWPTAGRQGNISTASQSQMSCASRNTPTGWEPITGGHPSGRRPKGRESSSEAMPVGMYKKGMVHQGYSHTSHNPPPDYLEESIATPSPPPRTMPALAFWLLCCALNSYHWSLGHLCGEKTLKVFKCYLSHLSDDGSQLSSAHGDMVSYG